MPTLQERLPELVADFVDSETDQVEETETPTPNSRTEGIHFMCPDCNQEWVTDTIGPV